MISSETMEGLQITGNGDYNNLHDYCFLFLIVKSFVEMAKYLLSDASAKLFLLSERISQDPLENYFGQQRARGGRNENLNFQQCLHNAAAIRVQKSIATDPVRGNCSRKRRLFEKEPPEISNKPLHKRKRH